MPVQSALTVYVPELWTLRSTCPLKLTESTLFTWPLPSKTSYPATANGPWSFPSIVDASKANRYVPCSVASEHFAPAASSSLANPLPTASTPTTPTSSTTHAAHSPLRLIPGPPLLVSPIVFPTRHRVGGPNESAMNPGQSYSSDVVEVDFSDVPLQHYA